MTSYLLNYPVRTTTSSKEFIRANLYPKKMRISADFSIRI